MTDEIEDGYRARTILDDETFTSAVHDVKAELFELWSNSSTGDAEGRERLYMMYTALDAVIGVLQQRVQDGFIAQERIREAARNERLN